MARVDLMKSFSSGPTRRRAVKFPFWNGSHVLFLALPQALGMARLPLVKWALYPQRIGNPFGRKRVWFGSKH